MQKQMKVWNHCSSLSSSKLLHENTDNGLIFFFVMGSIKYIENIKISILCYYLSWLEYRQKLIYNNVIKIQINNYRKRIALIKQ